MRLFHDTVSQVGPEQISPDRKIDLLKTDLKAASSGCVSYLFSSLP